MFGNGKNIHELIDTTAHLSKRLKDSEKIIEELDKAVRSMMSYMDARVAFYEKIIEKIVDRPAPAQEPVYNKADDYEEKEVKSAHSSILTPEQRKRLEEKKKRARKAEADYKSDTLSRTYDND